MSPQYRVIEADLRTDRNAILNVWARNFPVYDIRQHAARLTWNYESGPFGPGRCWLLLHGDDAVGTAGLGLRRLFTSGMPMVVGVASDLAVDAAHRCLQPALMLQKALASAVGPNLRVVYGMPNAKSASIFRRLKYENLGQAVRCVKVLRIEPFLGSHASGPLRLATDLLAPAVNIALRAVSLETWRPSRGGILRQLESFDARFDELWKKTTPAQGTASSRSARALRWRYSQYPLVQYSTLALLDHSGDTLLGYCVVYPSGQQEFGMVDFWSETASIEDLMAGVIGWCRSAGGSALTATIRDAGSLPACLRQFGFVAREAEGTLMARGCTDAALQALDDWCFMSGDEDYN